MAIFVVSLSVATPAAADDNEVAGNGPNAGEIIFDSVVLRPLGFVATVGGFAAFLLVAPWLAPSREIPYGWDSFVIGPADYTFRRPIGEF